jgi:hypothetical protein
MFLVVFSMAFVKDKAGMTFLFAQIIFKVDIKYFGVVYNLSQKFRIWYEVTVSALIQKTGNPVINYSNQSHN